MSQLWIFRIGRNHHRIAPQVSAFLGQIEPHILIFRQNGSCVAAVYHCHILVAVNHTVDYFIGHISRLHGLTLFHQPVIGSVDFRFIFRIHRIAQRFKGHHERIPLRIVHINFTSIFRIL